MNHVNAGKGSVVALALLFSGLASATPFSTVSLSTLNSNILSYTDGSAYSGLFSGSAAHTFGGVPFQLQQNLTGDNAYIAPVGNSILNIPVSVYGATNVYTLINSGWGSMGTTTGSLTFVGSGGASYTVDLTEGTNVRDHFYGGYVNTTSAPYVTQAVWGVNAPGNAHLDMQNFSLPTAFQTQSLMDIQFSGLNAGNPQGDPFLVGATVGAASTPTGVPEPASLGLFAMALTGLTLAKRGRNISL